MSIQGITIMFLAIDLALFFNSYVNPVALTALGWKYYIVYDVWLAFELFIVWWFWVETRNIALEEIAKCFDGDSAILGGDAATEKSRQLAEEVLGEGETAVPVGDKPTVAVQHTEHSESKV